MTIHALSAFEWGLWAIVLISGIKIIFGMLSMIYPRDPKPVPKGMVEDAVLVYTWPEAREHYQIKLKIWYVLAIVSLLLTVS